MLVVSQRGEMTNHHQIGSWLLFAGFLVGVGLLVRLWRFVRPFLIERLRQLGTWAAEHATPRPEFDQLADDLSKALRLEQLLKDAGRLQRILATDKSMAATRQLANRLAYRWILRDLQAAREASRSLATEGVSSWSFSTPTIQSVDVVGPHYSRRGLDVETLEIGWRR
jgi:hypothetical protein